MSPRALALVLSVVVIVAGCADDVDRPGATLDGIRQRGEITWGADKAGGEPFVYEDPSNPSELIGFEVDLMAGIARRLGVRARMVQYAWSNLVPSLERGDFDIAMNGLESTAERRSRILMSEPYYVFGQTLTIRAGDPYRSIFDLQGRTVGTLNQTVAYDILRSISRIDPKPYESNEEPYRDLALGRIDGVLLDNIIADRYACDKPALHCVPYDVARGVYVIGIRKGDDALKAAIDAALADMRASGELEQILRKHRLWDDRQRDPDTGTGVARPTRTFDLELLGQFASAAWITIELTVLAFLLAVPLGMLLAIARVYGGLVSRALARGYIELFRGTPVLLQLFVLFYGISDYLRLGPLQAAVLGLGMNYAAYEAEVYRGAILSIPRGQTEAARALGLSPLQTLWHVLLPQALRTALPPMTNDFVSLLKDSSLVGVIAIVELTKRMQIAAVDMRGYLVPGIACAAMYLALSFPLAELARRLERRLARDTRPHAL